jgi:hypothetical protein
MTEQAFKVRLVGVGHPNETGASRAELLGRARCGDVVELRREPDNPHDPLAIAVHAGCGGKLGYVPRGDRRLADHLDGGGGVVARIAHLGSGRGLLDRLLGRPGRGASCILRIEKTEARERRGAGSGDGGAP